MAPHSSPNKPTAFARYGSPNPGQYHSQEKAPGIFNSTTSSASYDDTNENFVSKPILKNGGRDKDVAHNPKAYDIVNAALQYGCVHNVIEKVGDLFLLRNTSDRGVCDRQPTPGPDRPKRRPRRKNVSKRSKRRRKVDQEDNSSTSSTRRKSRRRKRPRTASHEGSDEDYSTGGMRKRASVANYYPECAPPTKSKARRR